jgi:hypothetical protein
MEISFEVDDSGAFANLEGASDRVMERFAEELRPVEQAMLADARARAVAHFHSVGAKPGLYLGAFSGGVKKTPSGVVGWIRNDNQLAHLLEFGFTISDILIAVKHVGDVMAFEGDVGTLYREYVHRHSTGVQAYPAIHPAFEARKAEIEAAAERAARGD